MFEQDSSVMSKIYDTLGKKYKAKGLDGVQDFGVCMQTLFFFYVLQLCHFLAYLIYSFNVSGIQQFIE